MRITFVEDCYKKCLNFPNYNGVLKKYNSRIFYFPLFLIGLWIKSIKHNAKFSFSHLDLYVAHTYPALIKQRKNIQAILGKTHHTYTHAGLLPSLQFHVFLMCVTILLHHPCYSFIVMLFTLLGHFTSFFMPSWLGAAAAFVSTVYPISKWVMAWCHNIRQYSCSWSHKTTATIPKCVVVMLLPHTH